MKKINKSSLLVSMALFAAFAIWTLAVMTLDVKCVGPHSSAVGLSTVNTRFHKLTGVHLSLYVITDWLGLVPIAIAFGFAILGIIQLIGRRSIKNVDRSIIALGVFYATTVLAYIFFEFFHVNYRPILIDGVLEASYPSSTTLLTACVIPTAMGEFSTRIKNLRLRCLILTILAFFTAFMIIARLISGVHWLSDIIGGALLSSSLVTAYYALK